VPATNEEVALPEFSIEDPKMTHVGKRRATHGVERPIPARGVRPYLGAEEQLRDLLSVP
jgi:hypothetical protein